MGQNVPSYIHMTRYISACINAVDMSQSMFWYLASVLLHCFYYICLGVGWDISVMAQIITKSWKLGFSSYLSLKHKVLWEITWDDRIFLKKFHEYHFCYSITIQNYMLYKKKTNPIEINWKQWSIMSPITINIHFVQ